MALRPANTTQDTHRETSMRPTTIRTLQAWNCSILKMFLFARWMESLSGARNVQIGSQTARITVVVPVAASERWTTSALGKYSMCLMLPVSHLLTNFQLKGWRSYRRKQLQILSPIYRIHVPLLYAHNCCDGNLYPP